MEMTYSDRILVTLVSKLVSLRILHVYSGILHLFKYLRFALHEA